MFIKGILAYIVNKLLYVVPCTICSVILFLIITQKDSNEQSYGLFILILVPLVIILPGLGVSFYWMLLNNAFGLRELTNGLPYVIAALLPYILFETIMLRIFKTDIGSNLLKLKLKTIGGVKISIWRILLRTTIKYFCIAFCLPLLLFPLVSRRKAFLHERISGIYKNL